MLLLSASEPPNQGQFLIFLTKTRTGQNPVLVNFDALLSRLRASVANAEQG